MQISLAKAKQAILNKWDWENPNNNIPIFVWGPIGVGKTWTVTEVVVERIKKDIENSLKLTLPLKAMEDLNNKLTRLNNYERPEEIADIVDKHLLVLRLAERPIEQLQGVPTPDFAKGVTRFLMPENVVHFAESEWVVVFLDELDKADEAKMAAATHLIESGRIGDFCLPKDTFIIAAANRVSDSCLSKPIVPELRNRGAHIEVNADVEAWCAWARRKKLDNDIIRFIEFKSRTRENWLARYENSESDAAYGFPTPRGWHNASRQVQKLKRLNCPFEDVLSEIKQFVGDGAGVEFNTYMELYKSFDVSKILTGHQSIPTIGNDPKALNKQYVFAFAVMDQITAEMVDSEIKLSNLVRALNAIHKEIRVIIISSLCNNEKLLSMICNFPSGAEFVNEVIKHIEKIKG